MSTIKTINLIHPSSIINNIRMDANGNVGISTSNTGTFKLNVDGSVNAAAIFVAGSVNAAEIFVDGSVNASAIFVDDKFVVNTVGNVGIGTTNTSIYRLNVNGSVNASAIFVDGAPLAAGGSTITLNNDTANETRYIGFVNAISGNASTINVSSTKLTFNPNTGTLSATIFNSLSDSSLKNDVIVIDDALETVKSLNGVSFNWKDNGKKSYGVIAQDIEKFIPDIVDSVNGIKNVNYDGIIAFLIEAIKELNRKIDDK